MNILDFSTTALEATMANAIAGAGERKRAVGLSNGRFDHTKPYLVAAGASACFGRTA